MSRISTRTRMFRAAAVLGPAALVATSLAACTPNHPTSMDSPTPQSSEFHGSDGELAGEEPAPTATPENSSDAQDPDAVEDSVLGVTEPTRFSIQSFTVTNQETETQGITALQVTPAQDGEPSLIPLGLCSGSAYDVTSDDDSLVASQAAFSEEDCDAQELDLAKKLDTFLTSGDIQTSKTQSGFELTSGKDSLILKELSS